MNDRLERSVTVDNDRRGGKPVLQGTRMTVAQILAELGGGRSMYDLAEQTGLPARRIKDALYGLSQVFDQPGDEITLPEVLTTERTDTDPEDGIHVIVKAPEDHTLEGFRDVLDRGSSFDFIITEQTQNHLQMELPDESTLQRIQDHFPQYHIEQIPPHTPSSSE